MNVVKGEETLQKYNLKTGNKFASIRAIAVDKKAFYSLTMLGGVII